MFIIFKQIEELVLQNVKKSVYIAAPNNLSKENLNKKMYSPLF